MAKFNASEGTSQQNETVESVPEINSKENPVEIAKVYPKQIIITIKARNKLQVDFSHVYNYLSVAGK